MDWNRASKHELLGTCYIGRDQLWDLVTEAAEAPGLRLVRSFGLFRLGRPVKGFDSHGAEVTLSFYLDQSNHSSNSASVMSSNIFRGLQGTEVSQENIELYHLEVNSDGESRDSESNSSKTRN